MITPMLHVGQEYSVTPSEMHRIFKQEGGRIKDNLPHFFYTILESFYPHENDQHDQYLLQHANLEP